MNPEMKIIILLNELSVKRTSVLGRKENLNTKSRMPSVTSSVKIVELNLKSLNY
jgi:hypothetical protein